VDSMKLFSLNNLTLATLKLSHKTYQVKFPLESEVLRVKCMQRNSGLTAKSEFSFVKTTDGLEHKTLGRW